MKPNAMMALSPLDGRYATKVEDLKGIMNELHYMKCRVRVEIAWFYHLSRAGLTELPPLDASAIDALTQIIHNFNEDDGLAIKAFERVTNHDVKAVEYWLKEQFKKHEGLAPYHEFIHFACTSEDINNTSHALQLEEARSKVVLPSLDRIIKTMTDMAQQYSHTPMLSRTHGQTATPTTVGKECANIVHRLKKAYMNIENVSIVAKMNGAVGNYNAHLTAYPEIDWETFSKAVVESQEPLGLNLHFQSYSTQIEQHDYMAELFDAIARTNTILIDWARDVWGYTSLGYFKQRLKEGEVGSSTMPHKINPIDFENAEGNLGIANALLKHFSEKLPISRWQRDLTDSTVLRNMGTALGYSVLAYHSMQTGLLKLEINDVALQKDLDSAWEVLAEPIQTVMRRYGLPEPYEQLKSFTRGHHISRERLHAFIDSLALPDEVKNTLKTLSPSTYIGLAPHLAKKV